MKRKAFLRFLAAVPFFGAFFREATPENDNYGRSIVASQAWRDYQKKKNLLAANCVENLEISRRSK